MNSTKKDNDLFREIFNAIPLPVFRVNSDVGVLDLNRAAQKIFQADPAKALKKKSGDVLHCINAIAAKGGCGHSEQCNDCLIRNSVRQVFETGRAISRLHTRMEVSNDGMATPLDMLITVTPIHFNGELSALLCLEDITELNSLRGIIPICASCKKIRNDRHLWDSVDDYFHRFMGVDFTHSICPDCAERLYPEILEQLKD